MGNNPMPKYQWAIHNKDGKTVNTYPSLCDANDALHKMNNASEFYIALDNPEPPAKPETLNEGN